MLTPPLCTVGRFSEKRGDKSPTFEEPISSGVLTFLKERGGEGASKSIHFKELLLLRYLVI